MLSIMAFSAVLGLVTWLGLHAGIAQWTEPLTRKVNAWLEPLDPVLSVLSGLANALVLVLSSISPWVWAGFAGFCIAMYLSCVGLGTVFWQLAVSRRNHEHWS
jgi:hypothetical protein